eukprot:UN04463
MKKIDFCVVIYFEKVEQILLYLNILPSSFFVEIPGPVPKGSIYTYPRKQRLSTRCQGR